MTTDNSKEKHCLERLEAAYADGFAKGNAGMDVSYCPYEYLSSVVLKKKWNNGWTAGCEAAGIPLRNSNKRFLWWALGLLLFLSVAGYFNYRSLIGEKLAPMFSVTLAKETKPSAPIDAPQQVLIENESTDPQSHTPKGLVNITTENTTHKGTIKTDETVLKQNAAEVAPMKNEPTIENKEPIDTKKTSSTNSTLSISNTAHKTQPTTLSISAEQLKLKVTNPLFTNSVVNRVPGDALNTIDNNKIVYFYTNIRNFKGHSVRHRWVFNNQTITQKTFDIGGNRWRVYTAYAFPVGSNGLLTAQVYSEKNILMYEQTIAVNVLEGEITE